MQFASTISNIVSITENGDALNYTSDLKLESERFFSAACEFIFGTSQYSKLPESTLPEVAFIGRSNVGKSSLLNGLTKRRSLARVSVTPGRTQQINLFRLNNALLLVDLPGYGFAKAPLSVIKSWEKMTLTYLRKRENLKKIFLLIDARHGFKKNDLEFMAILDKIAVSYQIILTKLDKTNKEQIDSIIAFAKSESINHLAMFPYMILTSTRKQMGLEDLRTYIYHLIQ